RSVRHHGCRSAPRAEGGVMHVAVGMLGFAAVLAATVLLEQREAAFSGLIYRPALLLLCVGPLFISLISHKLEEMAVCTRTIWKAMRFSAVRSRAILHDELSRFAAGVRRGRPAEALAIAEGAQHELLRQLAPLVVKQYSPDDIERTAATASTVLASVMKRSEDVLTSLARVSPAVGLVGTTRELQEESAQDELWLISYADMLTLLVGFFVLIIASVPMKRAQFERIAAALTGTHQAPLEDLRDKVDALIARTPELKDKVRTRD